MVGTWFQRDLNARVGGVSLLVEMDFYDSVVIDVQCLAQGVLRDLEAPIHVATQGRGEVKADGQREGARAQRSKQPGMVRRAR